jgi:hypothetical protein
VRRDRNAARPAITPIPVLRSPASSVQVIPIARRGRDTVSPGGLRLAADVTRCAEFVLNVGICFGSRGT